MNQPSAFHQARIRKGLSIADVAKTVEVSRAAVSNWDRGMSYPRRAMALRLAELLGIDADALQREPVSHHAPEDVSEDITDIFVDARRRLAKVLKVPTHRIKLTFAIDG